MANPFDQYFQGGGAAPAPNQPAGGGNPFDQYFQNRAYSEQPVDAAHAQARAWLNQHPDYKPGFASGLAIKAGQGASMGWIDDAVAGAAAVRDKFSHGGDLAQNYTLEKAMQDEILKDAGKQTGGWGTAAEVAGGLATGMGAASNGLTAIRAGQGLLTRAAASAAEGAGYGAISGAGNAGTGRRLDGALEGAMTGGALGAAMPVAVAAAHGLASPVVSNIAARIDPEGAARAHVARYIDRTGRSPADIEQAIADARAAGQHDFVLADALDESGRTALRGMMRAPGEGRNLGTAFLDNRQIDQGLRIQHFANEAFGSTQTAQQHEAALRAARTAADQVNYPAAGRAADFVTPRETLQRFADPSGIPTEGVRPGADTGYDAALKLIADRNGSIVGYDEMLAAKQRIGGLAEEARRAGNAARARELQQVANSLDAQLEMATGGPAGEYRRANDTHAAYSSAIDAIETGQQNYGRATLPADAATNFNGLRTPAEQQAARVGFKDALVTAMPDTEGGNAARKLIAPGMQDKIQTHAVPGRADPFIDRLQRENTMFRTRNAALGGSPTADILAAQADAGGDPRMLGQVIVDAATGNLRGALMNGLRGIGDKLNGSTEPVRNEALRILFSGQINPTRAQSPLPAWAQARLGMQNRAPLSDLPALLREMQTGALAQQRFGANATRAATIAPIVGMMGGR